MCVYIHEKIKRKNYKKSKVSPARARVRVYVRQKIQKIFKNKEMTPVIDAGFALSFFL